MTQKSSFRRKLIFCKIAMSMFGENAVFDGKKNACGLVPQQSKGFRHILIYSQSGWDQITSPNQYFYYNFIDFGYFCWNLLKQICFFYQVNLLAEFWRGMSVPEEWRSPCFGTRKHLCGPIDEVSKTNKSSAFLVWKYKDENPRFGSQIIVSQTQQVALLASGKLVSILDYDLVCESKRWW